MVNWEYQCSWAPPQGGTEGTRPPPTKKLGGTSCLLSPLNHDGSAVNVIIPALQRAIHFNACLFLACTRARLFHTHENFR